MNATWKEIKPHGIPPPECLLAPKSRDNHNGNGPGGFTNKYNWVVPEDVNDNCVLRLRYNISTGDYPMNTSAEYSELISLFVLIFSAQRLRKKFSKN